MNQQTAHTNLKNAIALALQKEYGEKILINFRVTGRGFFPSGKRRKCGCEIMRGPYVMGNKGDSDIYGSLSFYECVALSFNIEVKSGKGELTRDQKKRKKIAENMKIRFFEGRDPQKVVAEFKVWEEFVILR